MAFKVALWVVTAILAVNVLVGLAAGYTWAVTESQTASNLVQVSLVTALITAVVGGGGLLIWADCA
jgi:hypothetical protein